MGSTSHSWFNLFVNLLFSFIVRTYFGAMFLKLSTVIFNKHVIRKIDINSAARTYTLHVDDRSWTGFMFCGSGSAWSNNSSKLTISEEDSIGDYRTVTKWIENMKNDD